MSYSSVNLPEGHPVKQIRPVVQPRGIWVQRAEFETYQELAVWAEKLLRRCRAIEISPAFVDGTIQRWQTATGKTAVLEATGQTFQAVTTERQTPQESSS